MIDSIKQQIIPILKKYGVSRASLFGSVVRGEDKKSSDVDILVDLPSNVRGFDYIDMRIDLQNELEKKLNKKVDLVEYTTIKPSLKKYILSSQLLIYSQ